MDNAGDVSVTCNRLIEDYPPPRCSLPEGHAGECKTTAIPAALSGVAADMLRGYDEMETTRTALHAERATLLVALRSSIAQRKVLIWSIALHTAAFLAWIASLVWAWQAVRGNA